jgi:hypothetical protein
MPHRGRSTSKVATLSPARTRGEHAVSTPHEPNASDRPVADEQSGKRTYFGRQGSPEITVAFPFAKVEVTRSDEALRTSIVAALQSVDALAEQIIALARASTDADRDAVVTAVHEVRAELDAVLTETATVDR